MAVEGIELLSKSMSEPASPETKGFEFRCPRCRGPLRARDKVSRCDACNADYPVRDGIHDFRCGRHDYYFNPVPRAAMAALIDDAKVVPWDETVRRFMGFVSNVPGWTDNVEVNARYAWKLFLELPPRSRFLDLGCGLGNLTRNIAPHVGEVVALDLTWERLRFAQQRFAKFNAADRITLVAGGDGTHLPFPDAHFDCVALSGVLEWIADDASQYAGRSRAGKLLGMARSYFGERNPRAVQLRFLKELRRVLKPDGQLFVAIENRWSHEYFGRRPDHHSRLWFGSLLPRFAANLYSIALRRRPYRTYTHTIGGLRRLFGEAGFPQNQAYGLTPGYSRLAEIVPTSTSEPRWAAPRPATRGERLSRSELFVPAFGIAGRDAMGRVNPLISRILAEIEARVPGLRSPTLHTCTITRGERIVIRLLAGDEALILKIPAAADALAAEDRNARTLAELARSGTLEGLVPRPLAQGVHQAVPYYVETAVAGVPMASDAAVMPRAAAARLVSELLARMQRAPNKAVLVPSTSVVYASEVQAPLARLADAGAARDLCDRLRDRLERGLGNAPWKVALRHGRLGPDSLYCNAGSLSGIIGWGHATAQGLPALDAIGYLAAMGRFHDPAIDSITLLRRLATWNWSCGEEVELLQATYARLGIDPAMHEALCLLAAVHSVAQASATTQRFDPAHVGRAIEPLRNWIGST
jgi:ubiquinone/menaquinone biosynthesis C-methylase UbiE